MPMNLISPYINPFLAYVPILYPLETPENLWFSGVFRGYKMGTLARNGLISELKSFHSKSEDSSQFFFIFYTFHAYKFGGGKENYGKIYVPTN